MCSNDTGHKFSLKKGEMLCDHCQKVAVYDPLTKTWK